MTVNKQKSNALNNLESLNSYPFFIDCLIDSSFFLKAMADTGCLCLAIINENFVRKENLYYEKPVPRLLRLADETITNKITKIAHI